MEKLAELGQFDNLVHGFTTRVQGNMSYLYGERYLYGEHDEVISNRRAALAHLYLDLDNVVAMRAFHSSAIIAVDSTFKTMGARRPDGPECDGLVTNEKGVVLALMPADCVPLLLFDPIAPTLGLLHVSLANASTDIVKRAVGLMVKMGADLNRIYAGLGPHIRRESYTKTNPTQRDNPRWDEFLHNLPHGDTSIDLTGYLLQDLAEIGIGPNRVCISPTDTGSSDLYFSHSQSVRFGTPEGRFMAVATIR